MVCCVGTDLFHSNKIAFHEANPAHCVSRAVLSKYGKIREGNLAPRARVTRCEYCPWMTAKS